MADITNFVSVESDVELLRSSVKDLIQADAELGEDLCLLRWLKACDMNPKKAERMMRASITFRRENNFDVISKFEFNPIFEKGIPFRLQGSARNGVPVISIEGGKVDFRGLVDTYGKDQVHRFVMSKIFCFEQSVINWNKENSKRNNVSGIPISRESFQGAIYLVDCKNISLRQMTSLKSIQVSTQICKDYISYIPVMTSRMILINCPRFGAPIVSMLKAILEGPSLSLEVYDTNVKKWTEEVHKKIHPDQLGVAFGGTRTED
ncbi:unnamed protein product [Allacma fusca]|uniref:CRAL-TRIO domain-containing protein n=1 Tax=Allacma fusca TaxID=39272 RepID=A0A8J2K7U9_9HEXA|nr:unnamed protein product [Allacma fusca]